MLTEVMRFYGLARPPVDAGFYETEHHAQVSRDIRAAIMGGRLIALTAVIGSGKTVLSRRLRADLEREGRVIVSRSLSIDKAKINLPLLEAALFYDLGAYGVGYWLMLWFRQDTNGDCHGRRGLPGMVSRNGEVDADTAAGGIPLSRPRRGAGCCG